MLWPITPPAGHLGRSEAAPIGPLSHASGSRTPMSAVPSTAAAAAGARQDAKNQAKTRRVGWDSPAGRAPGPSRRHFFLTDGACFFASRRRAVARVAAASRRSVRPPPPPFPTPPLPSLLPHFSPPVGISVGRRPLHPVPCGGGAADRCGRGRPLPPPPPCRSGWRCPPPGGFERCVCAATVTGTCYFFVCVSCPLQWVGGGECYPFLGPTAVFFFF